MKSLSTTHIRKLLSASRPFPKLRMRILLALGTGLRCGDIESWRVSDLDFENSCVTTRSKKTRKRMGSRPVPVPIIAELKKYDSGLDPKQERIFNRRFSQYRWNKIRKKLGLGDFTFHDLRKYAGFLIMPSRFSCFAYAELGINAKPLALCLLRTVSLRLSRKSCWNILRRI